MVARGAEHGAGGSEALGGHADLDPTVTIHLAGSGSYQGLDGSSHHWSDSRDLTLQADVHAALEVAAAFAHDQVTPG